MLDTLLAIGNTILSKSNKVSALTKLLALVKETDINQINTLMKV